MNPWSYQSIEIDAIYNSKDPVELESELNYKLATHDQLIIALQQKIDAQQQQIDNMIVPPKVCKGKSNQWQQQEAVYYWVIDIDMSHCNFDDPPALSNYVTHDGLVEGIHWEWKGYNAIYDLTKDGFRIHLYSAHDTTVGRSADVYGQHHFLHWVATELPDTPT